MCAVKETVELVLESTADELSESEAESDSEREDDEEGTVEVTMGDGDIYFHIIVDY